MSDSSKDKQIVHAILREQLTPFIQKTFYELNPSAEFKDNWHIEAMAWSLTQFLNGDIKRLIITLPPRNLKSISASVAMIAWALGRDPRMRFLCVSYGEDLAVKHSQDTQRVLKSSWYQKVFPKTILVEETKQKLTTSSNGHRIAVTPGGAVTGLGADFIVVDDINKASDMVYESRRKATLEFYENTLVTRLDDKQKGGILVIQQRLHEDDLVSTLLERGGWTHLNLPAIAEQSQTVSIGPNKVHMRSAGDVLHPAHEPIEVLNSLKSDMGDAKFSAQYQQRPTSAEGALIRREWFKRYKSVTIRPGGLICQAWDTAYTTNTTSDWTVGTTWYIWEDKFYLLDVFRQRLEYPAVKQAVISEARRYKTDVVMIEAAGAGQTLVQELRQTNEFRITSAKPVVSKEARLLKEYAALQSGHVYLPKEAPWLDCFLNEALGFPNGKHDDQVDSLVLFLMAERYRFSGSGISYQRWKPAS